MPQAHQASSPAAAVPLEALSPAEPWRPSTGPSIWFTVAALVVYRLGTYIPIPGIDIAAFTEAFEAQSSGILGMFNMFAGGAVERMAIFALNIMPYISALIIMQVATSLVPSLEALKSEGEQGRKQINQCARYLTVALAAFQAYTIAYWLEGLDAVVIEPGLFFRITTIVTMVGGTMLLMWLGEQITARGIGNGTSLIIMSSIVASIPGALAGLLALSRQGAISWPLLILLFDLMLAVVAAIVFVERAQRRLMMADPGLQGGTSHLPLKLNCPGLLPPIFASSLLLLPITMARFSVGTGADWLNAIVVSLGRGQPLYLLIYVALIVFFVFFYTPIVFNPQEAADDLRKHHRFVPGIRPGTRTAEYIDYVLTRITVIGAIYVAAACVLPEVLFHYAGVPFYFSGSALFIVVVGMLELWTFTKTLFRLPPAT